MREAGVYAGSRAWSSFSPCLVLHMTMCLHRPRPLILGTLRRAREVLRLVALSVSPLWITIRRTSSRLFRCCVDEFMYVFAFMLIRCYQSFFGATFAFAFHMSGWVCPWNPFWIPIGDYLKKALMEECVFIRDEHTDEQAPTDDPVFWSTDCSLYPWCNQDF